MKRKSASLFVMTVLVSLHASQLQAQSMGTLEIEVSASKNSNGHVGCALFSNGKGFPMETQRSVVQRHKATARAVRCVFENLKPGTYAVAVVHDENDNGKVDTNMFGIPKEAWGTSNNVTHTMSAPTFEESAVKVSDGTPTRIDVKLHDGRPSTPSRSPVAPGSGPYGARGLTAGPSPVGPLLRAKPEEGAGGLRAPWGQRRRAGSHRSAELPKVLAGTLPEP